MASAEDEDRGMRILAIALMCGTMVCFTGQDTCAKWLSASLPIAQIVWARYVGASLIALIASRPLSRPAILRSRRPRLQLLRSALLFVSTTANVFAVRQLQLSATATISFLMPVVVALLAGPVLGEKVSAERMIAIALGFLGVVIATRPGTGTSSRSFLSLSRALFAIQDTCWPPASSPGRMPLKRRSSGPKSLGSCF
jgi:drug/metabolite transporter (DMT)-like permease